MVDEKLKLISILNNTKIGSIGIQKEDIMLVDKEGEEQYLIKIRATGDGYEGLDKLHKLLSNVIQEDILEKETNLDNIHTEESREEIRIYVPKNSLNKIHN